MISEDTLKKLFALRTDTKNLDYKLSMNWASASNEEKCEPVKDILAMMNTQDGGQIIIGAPGSRRRLSDTNLGKLLAVCFTSSL